MYDWFNNMDDIYATRVPLSMISFNNVDEICGSRVPLSMIAFNNVDEIGGSRVPLSMIALTMWISSLILHFSHTLAFRYVFEN